MMIKINYCGHFNYIFSACCYLFGASLINVYPVGNGFVLVGLLHVVAMLNP
jgi:hypothetical protein